MVAYSFKHRFVVPIRVGLGLETSAAVKPKRQRIRAIGKRRHAHPGEELQLYRGMRTADCFLIGRAVCTDVKPVIIWPDENDFRISVSNLPLMPIELRDFSQADGFDDLEDMAMFWRVEHPGIQKFEGVVIEWRAI